MCFGIDVVLGSVAIGWLGGTLTTIYFMRKC